MGFFLGVVGLGDHDASAALVNDRGEVIAAAEEERYTRLKFDPSFPTHSIQHCLDRAGIKIQDVSAIGYYFDPSLFKREKILYALRNPRHLTGYVVKALKMARFGEFTRMLRAKFDYQGPVQLVPHHLCHAASVFFASPLENASIVSIDGVGEWETAWIGQGRERKIEKIESIQWPHSLGTVYAAVTQFLGFKYNSDEYKVMGLAAYGEPSFYEQWKKLITVSADGRFEVDPRYFDFAFGKARLYGTKFKDLFGEPNAVFTEPSKRDKDLAASLQRRIEDCFVSYIERATRLTGLKDVCLTGGVAMNCLAVGKLIERGKVGKVFIAPASSDAGCALGAAYFLASTRSESFTRTPLRSAYLGTCPDEESIHRALESSALVYEKCGESLLPRVAKLLAEGKVIGWYQGATEFGQRALGARSILASPLVPEMKTIINQKVKYRELYRPLAPAVIQERASDYFDLCEQESPYMTHTFKARPGVDKLLPAVVHADNTARVQTVKRPDAPLYYDLIDEFGKLTQHPVVLNTSFNVKGEPIVDSPLDAIRCYLNTNLDALAIGPYLVTDRGSAETKV